MIHTKKIRIRFIFIFAILFISLLLTGRSLCAIFELFAHFDKFLGELENTFSSSKIHSGIIFYFIIIFQIAQKPNKCRNVNLKYFF